MRRRGGGRIVITTSEWGTIGWPNAVAYAASKTGLISLIKTLGRELAPEGIIVNGVAPGITDTAQLDVDARNAGVSHAEIVERYGRDIPLGRVGRPEEIAATVVWRLRRRRPSSDRSCSPTAVRRGGSPSYFPRINGLAGS